MVEEKASRILELIAELVQQRDNYGEDLDGLQHSCELYKREAEARDREAADMEDRIHDLETILKDKHLG